MLFIALRAELRAVLRTPVTSSTFSMIRVAGKNLLHERTRSVYLALSQTDPKALLVNESSSDQTYITQMFKKLFLKKYIDFVTTCN